MLQEDIAATRRRSRSNPSDARLHADLAFCYLAAGRAADAIVQLEDAVRLEPKSAHAQYDLGTTLLNQKRLDEAAEHFDRALRLKPDFFRGVQQPRRRPGASRKIRRGDRVVHRGAPVEPARMGGAGQSGIAWPTRASCWRG